MFLLLLTTTIAMATSCATMPAVKCDGDDIKDAGKVTSVDECCALCSQHHSCRFFTFNKGIDQHCWLKSACSNRRSGDGRFISGTPNIQPPSYPNYTRTHTVDNTTFLAFFDFFTADDPTHGFVDYVSKDDAVASGMLQLDQGQILMSADTRNDTTNGRRSIRVQSKSTFTGGVIIIDLDHIPTGCGAWPAFWTCGPSWPNYGEIDIIEGVNRQTHDLTTLHTSQGCDMAAVDPGSFTGSWGKARDGHSNATDCWVHAPDQWGNAGCGITSDDSQSMGEGFNEQKGGVVATVWDPNVGVSVWNWRRKDVPSGIRAEPTPGVWGLPYARFEFGQNCDGNHFRQHQIIFDLTFCGDWAGNVFAQQCPNVGDSCEQYVGKAANVHDAFWAVNFIDVWEHSNQDTEGGRIRSGEEFYGATRMDPRFKG